jgi:hypothetical protein
MGIPGGKLEENESEIDVLKEKLKRDKHWNWS